MKSQTKTWFIRKSVLFLSTTVNGNKLLGAIILFRKVFTEEDKNNSIKYMKQLLFNFPRRVSVRPSWLILHKYVLDTPFEIEYT